MMLLMAMAVGARMELRSNHYQQHYCHGVDDDVGEADVGEADVDDDVCEADVDIDAGADDAAKKKTLGYDENVMRALAHFRRQHQKTKP
jgi:hypothetical protein